MNTDTNKLAKMFTDSWNEWRDEDQHVDTSNMEVFKVDPPSGSSGICYSARFRCPRGGWWVYVGSINVTAGVRFRFAQKSKTKELPDPELDAIIFKQEEDMKVNNELLNDGESVVECACCGEYWIVTDKTIGHNIEADGSHCRDCSHTDSSKYYWWG